MTLLILFMVLVAAAVALAVDTWIKYKDGVK